MRDRRFGRHLILVVVVAVSMWISSCRDVTPGVGLTVLAPYGANGPWPPALAWPGAPVLQ